MSVPLGERRGMLRGVVDLLSGRLPRFVFGASVGPMVPVFHFHDERRADLEPKFHYLVDNGYRTLNADELADVAAGRRKPGDGEVALCFDDAWSTVWTDASPLLTRAGLTAIVYAIPGRISDADKCRPTGVTAADDPAASPFMTWPELRAMSSAGSIDVQSHTWSHAMMFTSAEAVDFVQPEFERQPLLNRPVLSSKPRLRLVEPTELGAPLYEQRSRMSDGRQVAMPDEVHQACVATVRDGGGPAFFARPDWRATLHVLVVRHRGRGRVETDDEHRRAIEDELDRARTELNGRMGTQAVRHVCLPWGVSGQITAAALARLGFASAVANRWRGTFAVKPGDDPFWLKRLPSRYIFRLPGRKRRSVQAPALRSSTPQ